MGAPVSECAVGHEGVEDGTHLLKLSGDVASLLFVGVGEYGEVGAADFEPVIGSVARQDSEW